MVVLIIFCPKVRFCNTPIMLASASRAYGSAETLPVLNSVVTASTST